MTETEPAVDRIPLAHSVRYVARGLPDLPFLYGRGVIRPTEIVLTYRSAPDSQLGRVHAYATGRLWVDGHEASMGEGYGQHYDDGMTNWPQWLTEEARLHDPDTVPAVVSPPATDRAETRAAVAGVRSLHQQYRFAGDETTDYCAHCNQISGGWIPWPCPTIQALDAPAAGLRGEAGETQQDEERPRCPHCQMPHDLTPDVAAVCASIRASIPAGEAQQPEERDAACPHGCDTTHCPCLACDAAKDTREEQQGEDPS